MAPSDFSSQTYWENRFLARQTPFEWLLGVDDTTGILDPFIRDNVDPEKSAAILHIGCGTSDLSWRLRDYVSCPKQVHNVDFSVEAVNIGRRREEELLAARQGRGNSNEMPVEPGQSHMRWTAVDLLSMPRVRSLLDHDSKLYDVIVDKSTSDAVACGGYITMLSIRKGSGVGGDFGENSWPVSVHPVEVLALNLAAVTAVGCRWVSISYSGSRFWFVERNEGDPVKATAIRTTGTVPPQSDGSHYIAPYIFWRLEKKEQIELPEPGFGGSADNVHRPQVYHWLYVLVRTDVPFVSDP
ncbi:hypothetical protein H2204_006116 [Knufia peltigerae]|uniref:Methyltransferase domain-containing protein n=1 Tax=Knufia peltigerae TaxID=1002370 RepID=A0AA38Y417_9EURO|nr:hypothetical protein H2204_006116 [Knufia peltigerae]